MKHTHPADKMLAIYGSMTPHSLSLTLATKLGDVWRGWISNAYSDSLPPKTAAYLLITSFRKEIDLAVEDFIKSAMATADDLPEDFAKNCRELLKIPPNDTNVDDTPSD